MSTDLLSTLAGQEAGGAPEAAPTRAGAVSAARPWDVWFLSAVMALVGLGLVMLYSASAVMSAEKFGNHLYLVIGQAQKVGVGLIAMWVALRIDYRWYRRLVYPILAVTIVCLILVLIPGIGVVQNGARRWFGIAGMSFQPAEVAKITAIIFLAYSLDKKVGEMRKFSVAFVPHVVVIGALVALLMKQPDFGTSAILIVMMGILLFVSGARFVYLGGFVVAAGVMAYFAITARAYRMERVRAYLDPFEYRSGIGYQISESLISIGSGGLTGSGLGNGTGNLGYVPELWSDFIATIIAEELGLVGMVFLVALFVLIIWRGCLIAFRATDDFGRYLAFGITALLGLQATANLCVITGLLPNKGLTLPFVSFGGSSMMLGLFAVGILLNISRNEPDTWELEREERELRRSDRRWSRRKQSILRRRGDLRGE